MMLLFFRPWLRRIAGADLRAIGIYGLALGAMNLCFYMALRTIPFGVAVAIEFSGPLTVALLSTRRPLDIVWVILAATGLCLLLPLGLDATPLDATGLMFASAAAVFWAMYILFGKKVSHLDAGVSVSLGLLAASFVAVPIGLVHTGTALFSPAALVVGLGVALLSSAIPISLEMVALKRLSPQTFGVLLSLEPAVAAVIALGLLNEQLSAMQWCAIGLIVSASIGSSFSPDTQKNEVSQREEIAPDGV
jgi:inner membrane transporter RhtA